MHTSSTHAIKALYEKTVFNKITTKNNLEMGHYKPTKL